MSDEPELTDAAEEAEPDEQREALVAELLAELGDALLQSHVEGGRDVWVRVATEEWRYATETLRRLGFDSFTFLSAIDWLASPWGRDLDAVEDRNGSEPSDTPGGAAYSEIPRVSGGDTRFQVMVRLWSTSRCLGLTAKCDIAAEDPRVDSICEVYAGADWHEREAHEMYGIDFTGHPDLRKLYLPGDFEGYPLRKDFPLLARRVKPWPGIVDVEGMPTDGEDGEDADAGDDEVVE